MKKREINRKISEILGNIDPELIVCDNPLAVYYASKYRKSKRENINIIMDVTEWYPSKKNLAYLTGLKYLLKKIVLEVLNLNSGFKADGFIFGEEHKAKFFKKYFKRKPFVDLPYYPDLKYIEKWKPKEDYSKWNFFYSGLLNKDKGFNNLFESMKISAHANQNLAFVLIIITKDFLNEEQKLLFTNIPKNLKIEFKDYMTFEMFCKEISSYDIFLDLREKDKENNRCLPIKLFYYMACGKPSVFTDLDAIRLQVPEIDEFVSLTNSNDYINISQIITEYITNRDKYLQHSAAALKYSLEKYNWGVIANEFLKFISSLSSD
jgi:glycosyltransferase involved in cell wall biosynthesis